MTIDSSPMFLSHMIVPGDNNNTAFWKTLLAVLARSGAQNGAGKAAPLVAAGLILPGPDPRSARTPEEFVSKMRKMKVYTGLTLRQISERAGAHGELPKSTLADVLNKNALPKATLLRPFLQACGLTDDQIAVWESVHRRIAMEEVS